MSRPKKIRDKDISKMDIFILEFFGKQIFGERYEYIPLKNIQTDHSVAGQTGSDVQKNKKTKTWK